MVFLSLPRLAALVVAAISTASPVFAQSLPQVFLHIDEPGHAISAVTERSTHVGFRLEVTLALAETRATGARRMGDIQASGAPLWLVVDTPATQAEVDEWRTHLRALLAGTQPAVLELSLAGQSRQLATFLAQVAATETSGTGVTRVALGGTFALEVVYTRALAAYVDAVVVTGETERTRALRHLAEVDPGSVVLMTTAAAVTEPARAVADEVLRFIGTSVAARSWHVEVEQIPDVLRAVQALEKVLAGEVTELDARAASLRLTSGGQDVTAAVPHRLLFDNKGLATLLVYWGDQRSDPLEVSVTLPLGGVPGVHDVVAGRRLLPTGHERDQETSVTRLQVPLTGRPMLVDFNEEATEVFADRAGVSAIRRLTAEEVIARHRQQQARQDAAVHNYVARARLQQHFRPTVTDPGYDVVTDNRYFVDRDGIEWEELSFSVNGSKWGSDRPPFPLLQPEKVLSLPLQLRFDEDYRYSLEGTGKVDGYDCYLIRFEPIVADKRSLYRGTIWIDARTFARVRVKAVQTELSAPVVSNEETQVYRPVPLAGGPPVFLMSSLTARQIVLIAGRNLLLEKVATFESFELNAAGFTEERERARSSDRVMYRETDRGLRYFVKRGETRVVADRATTSARAMAIGVTIDPSYQFPLPMFGINYLDFEFRDPQTQLAILFAGVLAAGNIQRPKIGNSPLDASIDFFAIAVPSNDRIYKRDGEQPAERLLTWPLTTGGNLGWQFTPFQKAAVQYQFRFDGFVRDRDTAESFVPPPSTTTHAIGTLWEYRRGGYSVVLNGAWNRRLGWREWGNPESPETSSATYAKYSASVSRDFVLGPFQKIHVDGAWFGGKDLDRLSRYQFGLFDATRIHGVPSSGLRFDDLLMARGAYSFNIFEQYRLDLFVDRAWGRDEAASRDRQGITGIGAAVNVRAPWSTILRADIGKAFLPDRYRDIGSTVVQVMLLKPLR